MSSVKLGRNVYLLFTSIDIEKNNEMPGKQRGVVILKSHEVRPNEQHTSFATCMLRFLVIFFYKKKTCVSCLYY